MFLKKKQEASGWPLRVQRQRRNRPRPRCHSIQCRRQYGVERPGIDIVDLRDRFYVSPGASLRFSLPIAHMLGFLNDNFALTSQYKDGRFQIQHGVQRMSLVWVQQPGLPLRFEIAPPHDTGNYNPRPFPRVEAVSITSNLNIKPLFDGYNKSRDLRKILTKESSHLQETFRNVHFSSWSNRGSNILKLL